MQTSRSILFPLTASLSFKVLASELLESLSINLAIKSLSQFFSAHCKKRSKILDKNYSSDNLLFGIYIISYVSVQNLK